MWTNRLDSCPTRDYALACVMVAKVWTGMAFFAIIIMAALKTIPQDMYEAAAIDGSYPVKKFIYITLPSIRVILLLMVLLRAVQTINSPDLIFGMTQGGPAGSSPYRLQLYHDGGGKGQRLRPCIRGRRHFMAGNACLYGSLYRMHQHPERK